jgi:hypothetical protein
MAELEAGVRQGKGCVPVVCTRVAIVPVHAMQHHRLAVLQWYTDFNQQFDMYATNSCSYSNKRGGLRDVVLLWLQALEWFEGTALTRHEGPYLMGAEFSMLDIMMISSMERIGAGVLVWIQQLLMCYIECYIGQTLSLYGGCMSGRVQHAGHHDDQFHGED